jgi:phosphoribosylformimino-5-aminoimidazole carboxamide ribotide isomerase
MKVIPAMDLLGGRVVRLHRGDYAKATVYHAAPLAIVGEFVDAGAAWLHVVDLDGARDGAATQRELVASILAAYGSRLRVQVGGGVRTLEQVRAYVDAGATRVVVGTRAVEDPAFVEAAARICDVVVAVDARDGKVATHGWTVTTELTAVDLARALSARGAKAVLYTDIARDGTGEGPNVEATAALARAVLGVEVIASGGIGSRAHVEALAARPEIAACVVGRALYEGALTVREALAAGGAS